MLLIKALALCPPHGNLHEIHRSAQPLAGPGVPVQVHALPVVRHAQHLPVPQRPEVPSHLPPAVPVVDADVADTPLVLKIAVIDHKGDADAVPQALILVGAEAEQDHAVHVPHGGEFRRLHDIRRLFHHHEPAVPLDLVRQIVEGGGDKRVRKQTALILLVVFDDHADDTGIILGQQGSGHVGDIPPLLQLFLHPLHRLAGDLPGLPVDHVGHGGRAHPQLIGDVDDPHLVLRPHSRASVFTERPAPPAACRWRPA